MKTLFAVLLLLPFPFLHAAHADLLIAHARMWQEEDPRLQGRDEMMDHFSIYYDVLAVGRGVLTTHKPTPASPEFKAYPNSVLVSFYWRTATNPLPRDAILILCRDPACRSDGDYYALGLEVRRGIIPFAPDVWSNLLLKSDSDIVGPALASDMALAIAEKNAIEKGATSENIFLLPPRGEPFLDRIVNVFYSQPPHLYEYTLRLNERGDILNESMPMINRFYQAGEDLDAFMSRVYANDNRGVPFRLHPRPSASETQATAPEAAIHAPIP